MNRHRSRSPRRGDNVADAAKSGSSEQEIVSVAIKQLPADIRERLEKLFDEGLLKEGDLDLRSITVFASLNEGLQARVMNHMEGERIYVANARSKSGFLIATCDKAKTGCLDARGLGAIDPWRTALVAMATPKQKIHDLKNERDWLETQGEDTVIKIKVNLDRKAEDELGVPSVTVEVPLKDTATAVKSKLAAMGVKSIPANKMTLESTNIGFLKEHRTFAFYNLKEETECTLGERKRAGSRFRADHTVMPKRPRAQTNPAPAASPAPAPAGLPGFAGTMPGGLPGLPGLPKLGGPGMPALPGLAGLAGMLGKAGGPGGLADPKTMAALMGMDFSKGLPGLPPPGSDPKAAAMAAMAGMKMPPMPGMSGPGLGLGMASALQGGGIQAKGGMPGMPGGLPGMSMPGGMPPGLSKAGMPGLGMVAPGGCGAPMMMGSTPKAASPA